MKLVSLNCWGGQVKDILSFFNKYKDVDVFCLQEVLSGGNGMSKRGEIKSLFEDIQKVLLKHTGYFFEYGDGGYYSESSKDLDFKYGIAYFVKSNLIHSSGEGISLYNLEEKWNDYSGRFAAGCALSVSVENYSIINVHGLWQGSIKTDTEAKLAQSRKIIDLTIRTKGDKKIICGDFNLRPDTKSMFMIEKQFKNLIIENNIKSTRSSIYTKIEKFADFIFISKNIEPNDFKVLDEVVSDHLPLLLEFQ